jgi:hypothetical protein
MIFHFCFVTLGTAQMLIRAYSRWQASLAKSFRTERTLRSDDSLK